MQSCELVLERRRVILCITLVTYELSSLFLLCCHYSGEQVQHQSPPCVHSTYSHLSCGFWVCRTRLTCMKFYTKLKKMTPRQRRRADVCSIPVQCNWKYVGFNLNSLLYITYQVLGLPTLNKYPQQCISYSLESIVALCVVCISKIGL